MKKSRKKSDITTLSDDKKIEMIASHFEKILEILGIDLNDHSLSETPYRIAHMYVKEVFTGLNLKNFPEVSFLENRFQQKQNSNMVFVKVSFTSFCEHHFVPMTGMAYVAYVPNKKIIGLSKIPRIVRFFAKRPQLQERLTTQIADCLSSLLDTDHVAVSISAFHHCVLARGVEDKENKMITNDLRGKFNSQSTLRSEFFDAVMRTKKKHR